VGHANMLSSTALPQHESAFIAACINLCKLNAQIADNTHRTSRGVRASVPQPSWCQLVRSIYCTSHIGCTCVLTGQREQPWSSACNSGHTCDFDTKQPVVKRNRLEVLKDFHVTLARGHKQNLEVVPCAPQVILHVDISVFLSQAVAYE
jgi:hypothetical protein